MCVIGWPSLLTGPTDRSEKDQPAHGNKLALLEWRRQTGYESTESCECAVFAAVRGCARICEMRCMGGGARVAQTSRWKHDNHPCLRPHFALAVRHVAS
jgi:hypothetical protein